MEYAVEYALMSELYDERCVAFEGLGILGKIGRFLKSVWEWIVRKVGEMIAKLKGGRKKTSQAASAPKTPTGPAPEPESAVKLSELNSFTCKLIDRGNSIAHTVEKIYQSNATTSLTTLEEAIAGAEYFDTKIRIMVQTAYETGFAPENRLVNTDTILQGLEELKVTAARISKLVDRQSGSSEFKYSYMKPDEFKYSYMKPDGSDSKDSASITDIARRATDTVRMIIETVNAVVKLINTF